METFPELLRVIFGLKGLRRAEDPAGHMANFMLDTFGTGNKMYLDSTGNWSPWPGSLTVVVRSLSVCLTGVQWNER